jgi:hypothetical protein
MKVRKRDLEKLGRYVDRLFVRARKANQTAISSCMYDLGTRVGKLQLGTE